MNLNRSILPIAFVTLLVACSQQGEGERCLYGNADCASGLICIEARYLETEYASKFPADRCCPSDERASSDSRCQRKNESADTTGTAGAAGATGNVAGAAGGGMSAAGAGGDSAGSAGFTSETAGSAGAGI
jgi:hypothetical protein